MSESTTPPSPTPNEAAAEGERASGAERWMPLAAGLLLAIPVLLSAYPPMSDLPYHQLAVAILRHFGDRSMFPEGLYFINLGHPNQFFHLAALALSLVFSTTLACKLVVAATIVGIPLAAAHFADHVGASRWSAVIVAPVALGWLFFLGLVANLVGLAMLLALLPTLDRFVETPTTRGAWKVVGACVLLYLGHEAMMFLYAGTLLLLAVAQPWRLRDHALRLAPFVFAVALTLAQLKYQKGLFTPAASTGALFIPVWAKMLGMPGVLFSAYDLPSIRVVFLLILATIVSLAVRRVRAWRASGQAAPIGLRAKLHALRFEAVAACCFAAYLAYPTTLNGATFVYHRFLPPTFALVAVLASPRRVNGAAPALFRLTPLLASLAPVGALLVLWPAFAESSRASRDLESLIPRVQKMSAVAMISTTRDYHGYERATMGARIVAERGGRMLFSFVESPISPVMIRKEKQWNEAVMRVETDEHNFCPSYDFTRFRYVMLNTPSPDIQYMAARALAPEGRVVEVAGEWALFESTLEVGPIDAPDRHAPARCGYDTVGTRMEKLSEMLNEARDKGSALAPGAAPPAEGAAPSPVAPAAAPAK